ncbi:MAG: UDP-N-acetylmuramate dehydrogenase [Deltaproteobacteria bacterium]|nr:UDP-N-acetylmuramate dehydrogenase [Deltaproteobacteria bacterium]
MDDRQKSELMRLTNGKVRFGCPMAPFTTMNVGGEVEALVEAGDVQALQRIAAFADAEAIPLLPVGRGSNLLVTDDGLDGLVVLVMGAGIEQKEGPAGEKALSVEAGLGLADLLAHCRRLGLAGLEFLAGIPGSVGGAVAMNAGAFGSQIGDRVLEVRLVTGSGQLDVRGRAQLSFSYRHLRLEPGMTIAGALLGVQADSGDAVASRIGSHLKQRKQAQPVTRPSAGSVFKNPPNDYAGRLIESVGLKGRRIGGAMISPAHANYIVNAGGARAGDVLALLRLARDTVKRKTGITLEPEIRVVGK